MKVHLYIDEEIDKLKRSIFVRDIKYRRELEYEPLFKIWTIVMKYDFPELSAREIFERGGIDINIINKKIPQRRIKEWKDNYQKFGIKYFLPEDDYYNSVITTENNKIDDDSLKRQLMIFVIKRLKEISNEENR